MNYSIARQPIIFFVHMSYPENLRAFIRQEKILNFYAVRHYMVICTVCPKSSDPFYIESYYIKWVTTSCTYSTTIFFFSFCNISHSQEAEYYAILKH